MKKIKIALLLFFCATAMWAQDAMPTEEDRAKGKEINNIKRSGDAAYADVYQEAASESEALTEAEEKSKAMLQAHVIEIFAKRLGMSKKDVQDIWGVIESRCKHVVIKRGDLYRVFTYVMKAQFDPTYEPKVKQEPATEPAAPVVADATAVNEEVPVNEEVVEKAVAEKVIAATETAVTAAEEAVAEKVAEVKKAEETTVNETATTVVAEKVAEEVAKETVMKVVEEKKEEKVVVVEEPKKIVEEPKKEEVKPVEEEVITPAPEVLVPELCQKLIATQNWKSLTKFLSQEKAKNTLMWGSSNKMQFHEKCYIVVVERTGQTIVAVLDKGASDRMNFVSKKMDHFRNYKGGNYSCVFVQEY